MQRFKKPVMASAVIGLCIVFASVMAQTSSSKESYPMTTISPASSNSQLVPSTHAQVGRWQVTMDGEPGQLTRYERQDQRNAGMEGEHFSMVVADTGVLKGFAHISLDLVGKPLPTRERSEQIARDFLQAQAPDLLPRMEISWIEPHDEPIRVMEQGQPKTVQVTGMKVKARNLADKRWFWVIVGADEKVMVFERDIVWITFPGHRQTEKWLHDSWRKTQSVPALT